MSWFEAFIIALVEGLTEFLPVSSTGHMIIAQALMGVPSDEFVKLFTVNIQFGAIISVLVLYWKRFLKSLDFYYKLIIAFIPAAIAGLLLGDAIDSLLESPTVVAITLVLGGILLLKVDDWFKSTPVTYEEALDDPNRHADDVLITYPKAFIIGIFQCIALIPGVSRSAATIIGGLTQGISRKNAAEFSFFLAVPTMAAASGYKLLKVFLKGDPKILTDNIGLLVFGNVVAFIVAMLAIRFFIGFLTKHGFRIFGWYRIAAGLIILLLMALGVDLSIA
jgi:undecaprenyl-diphosphatase